MTMKNILLNFKRKTAHLLGIDIRPNDIRLVELSYGDSEYQVEGCKHVALDRSTTSDEMIVSTIKNILKQTRLGTKDTAFALTSSVAVFKEIEIPYGLSSKEIDNFLCFNLGVCLDAPEENINFDYKTIEKDAETNVASKVQLVAVKNEHVEKWRQLLLKAGLFPKIIDIDIYALERAIRYQEKNISGLVAVVNIDYGHILIVVLDDKKIVYVYEDFVDEENFRSIIQIITQLDLKMQLISSALSRLPDQLILAGEKVMLLGLVSAISDRFNIKTKVADPFWGMKFSRDLKLDLIQQASHLMLISFGLALRVGDHGG